MRFVVAVLLWCASASLAAGSDALLIDGTPSERAWRRAQEITEFALTQPFLRTAPRLKTSVSVLATPLGLAIAFVCEQPDVTRRSAPPRPRDALPNSDAVSVIVDFDGNGSRAYEFTVGAGGAQRDGIWSGENSFNEDWDGVWQSALASNATGWSAELLIPWSSVPMSKQEISAQSDQRSIRLSFDRAVWNLGERYSYPAISATQNRYLSEFAPLVIAQFTQSLLSVVPYASVQYDFVGDASSARAGADVAWRPNTDFALTATVRPDFGQVESDQLVVNFDAVEVAFSDKRPFFTENQAFFDVRDQNYNQLIYTRRVGAEGELAGAVKLTGSTQGIEYGAFAASESDVGGQDFLAARALISKERYSLGYVFTQVDSDFATRAQVHGADFKLFAGQSHRFDALLVASNRAEFSGDHSDFGGTAGWSYAGKAWDFGGFITHYGRDLNFNDFGYLAMADFNSINFNTSFRPQMARADGASVSYNLSLNFNADDRGNRLADELFAYRQFNGANGSFQSSQIQWFDAGFDNLISRGNGLMHRPARLRLVHAYRSPQYGKWKFNASLQNLEEGLGGRAWNTVVGGEYQATQALALDGNLRWRTSPDWLVWRGGDLFARYQRTLFSSNLNANWIPSPKHELRLKLQSLTINARNARAVRLGPRGVPFATDVQIAPLQVRNFGVQLRYKYEFAPLRELYVVYARGGFEQLLEQSRDSFELFQDSFDLRDSDQFLVKLRWGL